MKDIDSSSAAPGMLGLPGGPALGLRTRKPDRHGSGGSDRCAQETVPPKLGGAKADGFLARPGPAWEPQYPCHIRIADAIRR